MHIRVRNNVAQLIRTTYDKGIKKGKSTIVARVKLSRPELTADVRALLSAEEIAEFETWSRTQLKAAALREELAALGLPDQMAEAARWFAGHAGNESARPAAMAIATQWQALRQTLKKAGLLD